MIRQVKSPADAGLFVECNMALCAIREGSDQQFDRWLPSEWPEWLRSTCSTPFAVHSLSFYGGDYLRTRPCDDRAAAAMR